MSAKHRVVVGGSFGGLNAVHQFRRKLGDRVDVTLISAEADFTFIPSLPWVMMGRRKPDAIKVSLAGPLGRKGVLFIHDRSTACGSRNPASRRVNPRASAHSVVVALTHAPVGHMTGWATGLGGILQS